MAHEARLVETESGLVLVRVNVRDAVWSRNEAFGTSALFQPGERSPQLGVNLGVLEPGKPNCP